MKPLASFLENSSFNSKLPIIRFLIGQFQQKNKFHTHNKTKKVKQIISNLIKNKMLTKAIRYNFGFNILNAFKGIKEAVQAPVKHIKSALQPTGQNYSTQTNLTAEAFDEVAHEWQAFYGHNPFDLQTYNYLESAQLANFGTIDNPLVVFTADAPFRYVGCSGPQNEDDYESHELFWLMLREGPLQRCMVCGQVFKLVRLRNEFSSEMDYYMPNFNQLWYQDLGEHDTPSNLSLSKANTHFEHSMFEQPQDTVAVLVGSDEHDRILIDPAYRLQRQVEGEMKAKIYTTALEDIEKEEFLNATARQPITKVDYENLIEAEAAIKKLDRNFRKVVKFESRKYVDPINHERRQKRMNQRVQKRWDSSYTIFTGELTEEEQRYRDYFETDIENYREDERVQEFLDRQELLGDFKYSLNKYDFQQGYTISPQDDQTSYLEKKVFKFKYRRALDSKADYERRNLRMIQGQRARFEQGKYSELVENYMREPEKYEAEYLKMVSEETINQYRDYFQTENQQFDLELLSVNKHKVASAFENWTLPRADRSGYQTFALPKWNNELGFWANSVQLLQEVQSVGGKTLSLEGKMAVESVSTSALKKKE